MLNILFSWITKPILEQTPLDSFVIILEVAVLVTLFTWWVNRK